MAPKKHIILNYLRHFECLIPKKDCNNIAVSLKPVGWHVAHSLKVIQAICNTVQASDPKTYRSNLNLERSICFITNSMPIGWYIAPKSTLPPKNIETNYLKEELLATILKLSSFEKLDKYANFWHPCLGQLHKKNTLRYMEIHTLHHVKIIRKILR